MEEEDGDFEVTEDNYWHVVARFEKKKKRSYDFFTKAGDKFKESFLKLFKGMHRDLTRRRSCKSTRRDRCKTCPHSGLST